MSWSDFFEAALSNNKFKQLAGKACAPFELEPSRSVNKSC
jgi:hypothetical protein